MKHFLTGCVIATVISMIVAWLYVFLYWPTDSCLQQQAGYQAVVTSQTNMLQTQIDLLAKEKERAGLLQAAHAALQEELASTLAARVGKIDDIWAVKMPASWDGGAITAKIIYKTSTECKDSPCATVTFEQEPIEHRAARLAPVEAAVKEVATDNHEFIPAAFRSYWGQVLASGLMRGK